MGSSILLINNIFWKKGSSCRQVCKAVAREGSVGTCLPSCSLTNLPVAIAQPVPVLHSVSGAPQTCLHTGTTQELRRCGLEEEAVARQ